MNLEYVDHNLTTQRDWKRARQLHRKKLVEIVRTPSKRAYTPLPKFVVESKSRRRVERKKYSDHGKIHKENMALYSKICRVSPSVNVIAT